MAKKKARKKLGRPVADTPKGYWSIAQLARKEKVANNTVYNWIYTGKLKRSAKRDKLGHWIISKKTYIRPTKRH